MDEINRNTEEKDSSEKMLEYMKKQVFYSRITCILVLAVLVVLILLTRSMIRLSDNVNDLAPQAEQVMTDIDELTKEVADVTEELSTITDDLKSSASDIADIAESLNNEGLKEMYDTLEKAQEIDIDKLNKSIDGLYDVVEPLSRMFGVLKK